MLPDLLSNNLKLIICGTAAGNKSAFKQAYYSGPGNKFYKILFDTGFATSQLNPPDYKTLLTFGIGLTDLVKCKSGMDHTLQNKDYDLKEFRLKMEQFKPSFICFNGKEAARVFMGYSTTTKVSYGLQKTSLGKSKLYVATSTSGSACGSWDERYWYDLKNLIG